MNHRVGDKIRTRWDKKPEDYALREDVKSEKKLSTGEGQEHHKPGNDDDDNRAHNHHHHHHHHDGNRHHHHHHMIYHDHRPQYGKENGRGYSNSNTDKPKRVTGYMRGWDDEQDETSKWKYHERKEHKYKENYADQDYGRHSWSDGRYREIQTRERTGDDVEWRQRDRESRFKYHDDGSKHSMMRSGFTTGRYLFDPRANDMDDGRRRSRRSSGPLPGEKGAHGSYDYKDKGEGEGDGRRGHDDKDDHPHKGVRGDVGRGRRRVGSPTLTSVRSSRDEEESGTSSTESGSSCLKAKRSRSLSSDDSESWRRRASERSSRRSSKRKDRRTRSRSASRSSCDERERKKKKKEKEKEKSKKDKSSSRKDKDKEERRSVLTGKKIKLKVKKGKDDHERDVNRQELLQFLNSAYE